MHLKNSSKCQKAGAEGEDVVFFVCSFFLFKDLENSSECQKAGAEGEDQIVMQAL